MKTYKVQILNPRIRKPIELYVSIPKDDLHDAVRAAMLQSNLSEPSNINKAPSRIPGLYNFTVGQYHVSVQDMTEVYNRPKRTLKQPGEPEPKRKGIEIYKSKHRGVMMGTDYNESRSFTNKML